MSIDKDKIISEFSLKKFGNKGWMHSLNFPCPFCGKGGDKFGVYLSGEKPGYRCFRCDSKGNIRFLLKKIGRMDLYVEDNSISLLEQESLIGELIYNQKADVSACCESISQPMGFKRIYSDDYLSSRGFTTDQFDQFEAGISRHPKLREYLVFLIREDSRLVGYLGRTKYSKDWHKKNEERAKRGECKLLPRYRNAEVQFDEIVGGIDEIVQGKTHTVILVEGLMDKANTDRQLKLNDAEDIKCCFTFGNKVSEKQAIKIRNKGVEHIITLYDYGTVSQVQEFSLRIKHYFTSLLIGEILWDTDPGEMSRDEFNHVLSNLKTPLDYKVNRISSKLQIRNIR